MNEWVKQNNRNQRYQVWWMETYVTVVVGVVVVGVVFVGTFIF